MQYTEQPDGTGDPLTTTESAADSSVDIATAAQILGISVEALRKRLQRGAAAGYKNAEGSWRVILEADQAIDGRAGGLSGEVAQLREEVRLLKLHVGDLRRTLETALTSRPDRSVSSPAVDGEPAGSDHEDGHTVYIPEDETFLPENSTTLDRNEVERLVDEKVDALLRPVLLTLRDIIMRTHR